MSLTMSGAGLRWWVWGSFVATFAGVFAAGWLTPIREFLHSALLMSRSEWAPLLVIAGATAVVAAVGSMLIVLASNDFADSAWHSDGFKSMLRVLIETGGRRPRHHRGECRGEDDRPGVSMCGVSAGSALGVAVLLPFVASELVPREFDTLGVLWRAEAALDGGATPSLEQQPTGESTLLSGDGAGAAPVLDAFGHAINYEPANAGDSVAYTLRSLGADGVWSSDDLCVHGHTQELPVEGRLVDAPAFQQSLKAERVSWTDRMAVLQRTRCTESRLFIARAGQLRAR